MRISSSPPPRTGGPRAALDREQREARAATAAKHRQERDTLDQGTKALLDRARANVKARCKPRWRDLYHAQKSTSPASAPIRWNGRCTGLATATVLATQTGPLSLRQMIPLFVSGRKLKARIQRTQARERAELAPKERLATRMLTNKVYIAHKEMSDRQQAQGRARASRDRAQGHQLRARIAVRAGRVCR